LDNIEYARVYLKQMDKVYAELAEARAEVQKLKQEHHKTRILRCLDCDELRARIIDLETDQKALKSKLAEKDTELDQLNQSNDRWRGMQSDSREELAQVPRQANSLAAALRICQHYYDEYTQDEAMQKLVREALAEHAKHKGGG